MRYGPYSIRHDNIAVVHVRLWTGPERVLDAVDGRSVRVGIQRGGDVAWLATWNQYDVGIPANTHLLLATDLNYPLQLDDVIVGEDEEYGTPAEAAKGLVAEVQLTRVGEVEPTVVESRPGDPGGYEIRRPLVSNPNPGNVYLELLARQLNESGLPDLSIPIYF